MIALNCSPQDVQELAMGTYSVPMFVERAASGGGLEERRCVALWRRERHDVWRLESFDIDGEGLILVNELDGPFSKDLWRLRILEWLGV